MGVASGPGKFSWELATMTQEVTNLKVIYTFQWDKCSTGYRTGNHNYNGNNHGYSADEEDPASMTTNKKQLKVPDPSIRVDPRQPVLKVKKVQGSAWRPVPINKAIESSSEDSDDSYCSDDTMVAKTDT